MSTYLWLKFLHVLFAIAALGANLTYPVWLAQAKNKTVPVEGVLRTIEKLENRVANPAYGLLLVTGLAMVHVAGFWSVGWVHLVLGLYVLVLLGAVLGYAPSLRKQIRLAGTEGDGSDALEREMRKGQVIGIALVVLVAIIVWFMVMKPTL